jgi:hypothetical protein
MSGVNRFDVTPPHRGMTGLRVKARIDQDRAMVVVPQGTTGVIIQWDAEHNYIAVRLDRYLPGLEEWDNEVVITDADDDVENEQGSCIRAFRDYFEAA